MSPRAKIVRVLEHAAVMGDLDAQHQLGDLYVDGLRDARGRILVRRNAKHAKKWLVASAAAGHAPSFLSLGNLFASRGDLAEARKWYRCALLDIDLAGPAASNMAVTELQARRFSRALWWFERSREAGDGDAAVSCAYMKYYGIGTRRADPRAARQLTKKMPRLRTTPYAFEEAHYIEAVALLDRHRLANQKLIEALLEVAAKDGDYPEASVLLGQLREAHRRDVRCRCRRGRPAVWTVCTPCHTHPRRR